MWVSKWVIAAAVVGVDEVVDNVRSQIEFRLSGDYEGVSPSRVRGLTENLGEWWRQPLTPWVVVAVLIVLAVAGGPVASRSRGRRADRRRAARSSPPRCSAGTRALNNHSQIHSWLVYRSLPIAFGGLSALVCAAVRTAPTSGQLRRSSGRSDERVPERARG